MKKEEFLQKYLINRKGTNTLKWDALESRFNDPDLISMWIADMEFRTPDCVVEALHKRVEHGVYGYSFVPDSYYEAVINWEKKHHGYEVKKEWMRITPGIVSALYWSVNLYTNPNDAIIIMPPVYYPFHNCVRDSKRRLITCDLINDKGRFSIDFDNFEKKVIENEVKMYIHCSPANPSGRVWTEAESERLFEICKKHNVLILSDEIHQDLVLGDRKHLPSALVANGRYKDNMITAFASSKTFNLATCLTSTVVIENDNLRKMWDDFVKIYHSVEVNIFGLTAVEAALRGGEEWYEALKDVLRSNHQMVLDEMKEFPEVIISPLEGTYLVFMDLSHYVNPDQIEEFVQGKCRLAVDYGEWFGANFKGFIRLNLATDPKIVKQAIHNIKESLRTL